MYSRSQKDFRRTGEIANQVTTEFSDATYSEMYAFIEKVRKATGSRAIIPEPFLVLDNNSVNDRKVVLVDESWRTLHAEDENEEIGFKGPDEKIWRRHRVPFENVAFFTGVIISQPGDEGDEFLQNTTFKTLEGL